MTKDKKNIQWGKDENWTTTYKRIKLDYCLK